MRRFRIISIESQGHRDEPDPLGQRSMRRSLYRSKSQAALSMGPRPAPYLPESYMVSVDGQSISDSETPKRLHNAAIRSSCPGSSTNTPLRL